MKRRDFLSVAGLGAVGATLPTRGSGFSGEASGQTDPRFEEISNLIEAKMAQYRVPGVGFGLRKNGVTTLRGFGLTSVDNPQPVTPDTIFPSASITKSMVAVAILRLVESGRVALDAPVREYLPDFRTKDEEASRAVTIRHLLTHTPGWFGDRGEGDHEATVRSLTDAVSLAQPGETWSYNNVGFTVAGRVLEVVTGLPIHGAMRTLLFAPLALPHAFTQPEQALTYRFAMPHFERDGRTQVLRPFSIPPHASGNAALSLESMMRYAEFQLGDGTGPTGEPLLRRGSLDLMRTSQLTKRPTTEEMGVGFHLRHLGGVLTAVHCGQLFGHSLHLQLVPERDLAFTLLTNHGHGWRLNSDVERMILSTYEDLALEPNQAIGCDRGGFEDVSTHASPMSTQPSPAGYVGSYHREPGPPPITISSDGPRTRATGVIFGLPFDMHLVFCGPDRAWAQPVGGEDGEAIYPYHGAPVEFVRDETGQVRWCRIAGRITAKA